MIGQKTLLKKIDKLIESGFPRFILLIGCKGSGKKLISREIANKLHCPLVSIGTKADEVREVITNAYRNTQPIVYILPDTDKMSVAAKNAMLKITEEPPQQAYFIMTVTNKENTLGTLISRACVLQMEHYDVDVLEEYLNKKYDITKLSNADIDFITYTATVPEEVDTLMTYDIKEFREFIEKTCSHLHEVSAANCFKIENKLALKKDEDKWDVLLTLQGMKSIYLDYFIDGKGAPFYYAYMLVCDTINTILYNNSPSKQYYLDKLILDIRKAFWKENNN